MRQRSWSRWLRTKITLRHSIRHRIMATFAVLMAVMLLAIWAVDNFWLEGYYVGQKQTMMEKAYTDVNQVLMEQLNEGKTVSGIIKQELEEEWNVWSKGSSGTEQKASGLLSTIRTYGEQSDITTVLIDSYTGKTLLSSGWETDFLARKVQGYVLGRDEERSKVLKQGEGYVVEVNYDYRSKASYMESWGFFSDNRTMFIMSMPLAGIQESVELFNRFITFVGLAVLVAGCFVMYFVTRRITNPILALASLSEEMSRLNFDVSYEAGAEDEIGVLGRSMNTLSDKLKETIGALQEANRQLQHDIEEKIQIDEMRKDFIANVSHELKTPIALIQGYAEGLTEGMCEDEESRSYYCEVIMDEANKMNKMVRQLLTLTALEFGKDMPAMEPFDLAELIRDLVNSSSILIQQNDAHVQVEAPEELWVLGDEFKIEEVVTNYLTNGMHHLNGPRKIRIRVSQEAGKARVAVYNTGSPIPEEDLPNLWTKFYKVDKARTRAYGGSGIGLSIVKAIMDAHHEDCGVANVEGGVEFWFTMQTVERPEER